MELSLWSQIGFICNFIMTGKMWETPLISPKAHLVYQSKIFHSWYYWHLAPQCFLSCGGCPVHCRMLSGISDLYPPGASSILPSCDNQTVSGHCQMSSVGQNCSNMMTQILWHSCLSSSSFPTLSPPLLYFLLPVQSVAPVTENMTHYTKSIQFCWMNEWISGRMKVTRYKRNQYSNQRFISFEPL